MNRREWLRFTIASTAMTHAIPRALADAQTHKSVILVELAGANDGLNTVVPYGDDTYYRLRPRLGLKGEDILALDDYFALNAAMPNMARLFKEGHLSVVHNLGYPNQNQSHFRSIEIWERGGDGNQTPREGWPVSAAAKMQAQGAEAGGAYLGGTSNIFHGGAGGFFGGNFNSIIRMVRDADTSATGGMGLLGKMRAQRADTQARLLNVDKKLENANRFAIQGGAVGRQLSDVLRLIDAGVNIPFYKVTQTGFDTHVNQEGTHRELLRDLDGALADAYAHLRKIGRAQDVMIMTYSEFGRRPKENGARGTDHGSAAPHFVFGGGLPAGHIGRAPGLDDLSDGNLKFDYDYRSLYAHVLGEHFGLVDHAFSDFTRPFTPYS